MLGGISASSVPPLATTPVASPLSYLCLSISGTATRAMVAAAAMLDPDAAPKPGAGPVGRDRKPARQAAEPGMRRAVEPRRRCPNCRRPHPSAGTSGWLTVPSSRRTRTACRCSALSATLKLRRYQNPKNATAPIATPIGTRSPISTRMPAMLVSESASVLIHASGALVLRPRAMSEATRSRR